MGRDASEALARPQDEAPRGGRGLWSVRGIIESGSPKLGYEDRFCRANDQTLPVEVFASPMEGNYGGVEGAVLAFADITERREREQQARWDGEAIRQALADTGLAHWSWDLINDRHHWSEALYRLLGLEPGSVPASLETLSERLHPDDADTFREAGERAQKGEVPLLLDIRVQHPDGGERTLGLQGSVGRNPDGEIVPLSGIAQDVTDAPDPGQPINLEALTLREREVLSKLARGLTTKEVARGLGVSPRTVEEHRARIMDKLRVRSFAEFIPLPR
ncbi:LuxR C-terminal-related transcriptional regulator [Thiohalorhabdus sp.]|uniref:LuxR C-terminal-related transcriptional regulator n=1 Tax=Thiohalorhabdus sp. TaxID=3094134 RepID=UPI002FC299C9